uniref:P-type Ca(2+) transporter n=1 Tax=Quercus lobata TaxID=97700 RepID=A0A7N2LWE0_QUELO
MPTISIILDNLESIQSLLNVPNTLSEPKKRWRSAFVSIYYYRAFLSLIKTSLSKKKNTKISPSQSFIILDLNQDNRLKTDQASLTKIDQKILTELVKEKNIEKLQLIGGVDRLASGLKTNVESGIQGNIEDIAHRHETFGTNTYKRPPTKSFFHFVVKAFKDLTILILLGCAVLSLVFGIKENGIKEGWYDGGSIFVAIFLVIAVSTISNFRQNRQFDKLSQVSNNIQIEVVRAGRRQQISIFEIVVGDVICLKIGDQVPADGLFLDGHSLQVDESSMTGESDHVEVNCSHPFLFSGTKVVDGYARMLVTSVGMNTIWGEMMSSISRDTNEQTPLQVRLNKLTSSIDENGNKEFNGSSTKADDILNDVVGFVAAAVTIVVVAIPEGLPLAVTLTLAYSMKRMMADQAMVRKLSACETMGSATTICTDKTGTLTLNKMKVTKFWLGKESFAPATYSSITPYILELLQEGVALNTTSSVYRLTSGSEIEFSGSPTEQAILSWAVLELNMEMEQLTQSRKILYVEAFNSQKKRSGVITRRKTDNTIHDPCRPGVKKAVEDCQNARVKIKMVAGDNVFTAKAIATECGILRFDQDMSGAVVEGIEFRNYTPKERMEKVDNICVMARSSPFDKLLMVECLKQKGHVVAVTGDGTNDAPALKEADIGLSMGIQGTEVAKESSDIVILDDNFASVATILRWGRCVYNNIQKFIQFQLTVNVAALVINFVAAVSAGEVPLTAVQLLWVNLIMDTLGALALATEKPTEELMTKPPVGESIFGVTEKVNDTLIFNTFVLCQVLNEFNARKLEKKNVFKGIHKNKLFLGIIAITIVLQVVMVEFLKKFAVDTCSKKTISQLPKHEKDARTSNPIFVHIEDKPKVDWCLIACNYVLEPGDQVAE